LEKNCSGWRGNTGKPELSIGVLSMQDSYFQDVNETFDKIQNEAKDAGSDLKSKLSETATKAKDKIQEVSRKVQAKIEENRTPAAEKLQNAASALHQKADALPGGETVAGIAHKTANTMQATAEYVRGHNLQDARADVETFVRKRPGATLIAAAAVGFLIGHRFRRQN
jgi:ElaB/YqjD/DUF883 family membrane-anchored ribosome-binding protein